MRRIAATGTIRCITTFRPSRICSLFLKWRWRYERWKALRISVLGANGQLGCDVCNAFGRIGDDVTGLTHTDIEVSSESSVGTVLAAIKPDIIVNTAAMHHVEKCEADPTGSFAVNGIGARN